MRRVLLLILLLTACTSQGPPESAASSELEAIGLVQEHLGTIDVPGYETRSGFVQGPSDCRTKVMASVSVWRATQTEDGTWEVQAGVYLKSSLEARRSVLRGGTPAPEFSATPAPPNHEWSLLPSGVVATTVGDC